MPPLPASPSHNSIRPLKPADAHASSGKRRWPSGPILAAQAMRVQSERSRAVSLAYKNYVPDVDLLGPLMNTWVAAGEHARAAAGAGRALANEPARWLARRRSCGRPSARRKFPPQSGGEPSTNSDRSKSSTKSFRPTAAGSRESRAGRFELFSERLIPVAQQNVAAAPFRIMKWAKAQLPRIGPVRASGQFDRPPRAAKSKPRSPIIAAWPSCDAPSAASAGCRRSSRP